VSTPQDSQQQQQQQQVVQQRKQHQNLLKHLGSLHFSQVIRWNEIKIAKRC